MIFVNLPVVELDRATAFYEALGATRNPRFCDATAACMVFSKNIHVMLLTHARFQDFTPRKIADARTVSEVLLCISAERRAEVDEIMARACAAGGAGDPCPLQEHGFMYGRSVEDPDGHVWEIVWMDPDAATAGDPATAGA
ncbi:glyoxalase/bleomycin resistance/extradiol dioxygenase family protein [Geminicoccaceae bacterium 1502E]|nr:glyoxalase/bleomycin resistance/extradiol dioxygenase family protein [Geminicoccaceae bacterium 1502E]